MLALVVSNEGFWWMSPGISTTARLEALPPEAEGKLRFHSLNMDS
jgi:hypothetical protein